MKYRITDIFLLLLFQVGIVTAQTEKVLTLQFNPVMGNNTLVADKVFYSNGDSITMEVLRFYISGIELLLNETTIWKEQNSFHLIDAVLINSLSVQLKQSSQLNYNKVKFNIGIDSSTNVAGAMGGDLDPTKGMYWTWQSGYINFKLEGKSKRCTARNNEFTFHLGGYQKPFNAMQTVVLEIGNTEILNIKLDLDKLISQIDLSKQNHIMSPGKEAVSLSEIVSKAFSIQ